MAEAARQERARKQSQPKKNKHVYTAEDLKREHILTPENRVQLEAKKNQPSPADTHRPQDAGGASVAAHDTDTSAFAAGAPLGDVARRLRKQKESQKLERSAEFHLPFSDAPVLATPRTPVQPLSPLARPAAPAPQVGGPAPLRPHVKRSPFERPRVLPPGTALVAPAPRAPRAVPVPAPSTSAPPAAYVVATPPPSRVSPPAPAKLSIVTVKPGDSLWSLAAERFGNGRRWQELLVLNPGLHDPNFIRAGSQVVLPVFVALAGASSKYKVRQGDTLWSIAQTHFGHGSSWPCIAHANPAVIDSDIIHEGQVILLPASCSR